MNSVDLTQHIFIQLYSIHCVVLHCLYIPHYKYLLVFCYQSRCIPFLSCCEWSSKKHECASVSVIIYRVTWVHDWEGWHWYIAPFFVLFCFVFHYFWWHFQTDFQSHYSSLGTHIKASKDYILSVYTWLFVIIYILAYSHHTEVKLEL